MRVEIIERAPGRVGDSLRRANDALGRPLADTDELEDRRAFVARSAPSATPSPTPIPNWAKADLTRRRPLDGPSWSV